MARKYSKELDDIERELKKAGFKGDKKIYPAFLSPGDIESYDVQLNGWRKGRMIGFYNNRDELFIIGEINSKNYFVLKDFPETSKFKNFLKNYGFKEKSLEDF